MSLFDPEWLRDAEEILELCRAQNVTLATAESCTGGLIAALFTEIPGSSDVFDRGFVTYSNEAKLQMLNVAFPQIDSYGAVSREVAVAMAQGAVMQSDAHVSVAVTGIAGPGGGSMEKPVGTVHIASHFLGRETRHEQHLFFGERGGIRLEAAKAALALLRSWF